MHGIVAELGKLAYLIRLVSIVRLGKVCLESILSFVSQVGIVNNKYSKHSK